MIFALRGRTRPYFKYLEWELERYPLEKIADSKEFTNDILKILETADAATQKKILQQTEEISRAEGYGSTWDAWGNKLHAHVSS